MKRGRWILVIVLLVMCGSVAVVELRREREPVYEGKKLSEWLGEAGLKIGWGYREVAVGQIGTNALPFLMRWIQYETPAWRRIVAGAAGKLHLSIFSSDVKDEFDYGEQAIRGFEILGSNARSAIPELVALTRAKRPRTQNLAGRALGLIGAEAVPAFLSMVRNPPAGPGPYLIALAPGWQNLGMEARVGVPVLVEWLTGTNARMARISAQLLGSNPLEPEVVVPALSNAVQASDTVLRLCALKGLRQFGEQARSVTPLLVECLDDSDPNVRAAATNVLSKIAPEVLGGK